jgi:hypothetical protein
VDAMLIAGFTQSNNPPTQPFTGAIYTAVRSFAAYMDMHAVYAVYGKKGETHIKQQHDEIYLERPIFS